MAHLRASLKNKGREYQLVGTGDALRNARSAGTELGKKAAKYMDEGKLVPSEIINPAVESLVTQYHNNKETRKKLWMFNGYPRAKDQVDPYLDLVRTFGRKDVSLVLSLGSPEQAIEIMLLRAAKRVQDAIDADIEPRADDDPKIVVERYSEARDQLDPVVERLMKEGFVVMIDGAAPEQIVTRTIRQRMESIGVL